MPKYVIITESHEDAGFISMVYDEKEGSYLLDTYHGDQMWVDKKQCKPVSKNAPEKLKNMLTRDEWLMLIWFLSTEVGYPVYREETRAESILKCAEENGLIKK